MIKRLLLFAFLLLPFAVHAQQWSTLDADLLVSMNTSIPGTTLTPSIANAGMVSSKCIAGRSCSFSGSLSQCGTCFSVGANQSACSNLGAVQMKGTGGILFPAQSLNSNNMAHDDSQNNTSADLQFTGAPASATIVATLACITLGPPSQITSGSDWDVLGIWDSNGDYWEAQLNNKCTGSSINYGIRLETKPTAHSGNCVALAPQGTYWVEVIVNTNTGFSMMYVWTAGGELMGTAALTAGNFGHPLRYIQIGNNENGNNSGTTTYYQNLMAFWTGLTCTSTTNCPPVFWTNNSLAAGVLSPNRFSNWTPGVVGGIPANRTQCVTAACTTVGSGPASSITSSQINSAIMSASAGTYVLLPAGTYSSATGCITFGGKSNVTLRGAGANQTFLAPKSTSGCNGSILMGSTSNSAGSPQNGPVAVKGSTVQGSTTLTLASVSFLKVGNPIILDQLDPACDNGGIFASGTGAGYTCTGTPPGSGGPYNTQGGGNAIRGGSGCSRGPTGCYHQQQIVEVTSCNGDTTVGAACAGKNLVVGIFPGLHMPNWSTANMFAWWATSPGLNDGLEDLHIDSSGNSGAIGIEMANCQGCWIKGIASTDTSEAHVQMLYSNLGTIRNSYFFLTQNAATVSYGTECESCSDMLIENNIFQAVTAPHIVNGPASGVVWGYNFDVNMTFTRSKNFSIPAQGNHASMTDTILEEGNIGNGWTGDVIHGTGDMNTAFRNAYHTQPACWQSGATYTSYVYGACTSGITTMQIYAFHRFYSLIGNVLGTSGKQTTYCNGTTACSRAFTANNTNVFGVGYGNGGVPNDSNTVSTIMLWGNADPVTGYGSPRFNCSEVPQFPTSGTGTSSIIGVQLPYLNACPSSHTLPASFYYSSTPSWWPTGKPWPPIGPDVKGGNILATSGYSHGAAFVTNSSQCSGCNTSTYANGEINSNPAMDCYLSQGSLPDGTGSELSFNENTCYGGGATNDPAHPR